MIKNKIANTLDYTNSLTQGFNEQEKAFNSINVNSFIPARYGKVALTYVAEGNGAGKIETATYYSEGKYQETKVTTRGNMLGTAHKTTISFVNRTANSLKGKCFVMFDNAGGTRIGYTVDGDGAGDFLSSEDTVRDIVIDLSASDSHETIARKTSQVINADSEYIALYYSYFVIISSSTSGIKPDSHDINTNLILVNKAGTTPKSLNNTYWYLNSALDAQQYYIWYNVSGSGTDPLITGKTGLMVAISSTYTDEQVASATKTVLDATDKFITNISGSTLSICNKTIGTTTLIQNNTADFLILPEVVGESREVIAILEITYNDDNEIATVERL